MRKPTCAINVKLLSQLKELIQEEKLPIELEEGNSFTDENGDQMIYVYIVPDKPDMPDEILNDAFSKAVNWAFNLT